MAIKLAMYLLVILMPCVWLIKQEGKENLPMKIAKEFADHLIHARFNEAASLATPASLDDITFYATWVGSQSHELNSGEARFKVTHAQVVMPADSVTLIRGVVLIPQADGSECEVQQLNIEMVCTAESGWLVNYKADVL